MKKIHIIGLLLIAFSIGYFIINFRFDSQEFLNENKDILTTEYKNLKHLLGN